MRILHSSDWHIGFVADEIPLLAAQEQMLAEIAELTAELSASVVIVSGDVYDKENPSEAEITVVQAAFERIVAGGAHVIVTAGNHDSAVRLGAGAMFTTYGGLHLLTSTAGIGHPVLIEDQYGPIAFYGIPCLHFARKELGVPPGHPYADYWRAAMARVRRDLESRPGARSVVIAHAPVADPSARGIARLQTGGSPSTVPVDVFDGIDYVALGDLHWPHAVSPAVRYSGSPLPYVYKNRPKTVDFDPPKSVCVVDLGPDGLLTADPYPLPVPSGTKLVGGSLLELSAHEGSLDYVCATLTDPVRPVDAWRQLRLRFPYLIHIDWVRSDTGDLIPIPRDESDHEVVVIGDSPAVHGPWRGFYGELGHECLRCGASAEHPCFRIRCIGGAFTNSTYHPERGLTEAELAELGYLAYDVADDTGVCRRLWHDPRAKQAYVKREGCNPVLTGQRDDPALTQPAARREPHPCARPGCRRIVVPQRVGRPAKYCSITCRVRAYRARESSNTT
ncbi:exonuclease subunit SbcD [Nocardia nepalensis]|uniref:exonuclease subunit SbcD n=1 Tax=Nocardia nepalensis TaxID=3375448 RepID=UPI003B67C681